MFNRPMTCTRVHVQAATAAAPGNENQSLKYAPAAIMLAMKHPAEVSIAYTVACFAT